MVVAGLPLLTVAPTIGKYVVFLTQLFAPRLDRQRSVEKDTVLPRSVRFLSVLLFCFSLRDHLIQRLCLEHPRGEFFLEFLKVRVRGELLFLQVLFRILT